MITQMTIGEPGYASALPPWSQRELLLAAEQGPLPGPSWLHSTGTSIT